MRRTIAVVAGLAMVAAGSAAVAANPPNFNLPWRTQPKASSFTGSRTTLTWALSTYNETRVASHSNPDPGEDFDVTHVRCHGGTARVTWYVGDLEPHNPESGVHVSIYMDKKQIGTGIRGGKTGSWEDAPAAIDTVTRCPRGRHTFSVRAPMSGPDFFGLPYAEPRDRVQRGFIIEEVWNPKS
jgi:hypothetical protein